MAYGELGFNSGKTNVNNYLSSSVKDGATKRIMHEKKSEEETVTISDADFKKAMQGAMAGVPGLSGTGGAVDTVSPSFHDNKGKTGAVA